MYTAFKNSFSLIDIPDGWPQQKDMYGRYHIKISHYNRSIEEALISLGYSDHKEEYRIFHKGIWHKVFIGETQWVFMKWNRTGILEAELQDRSGKCIQHN